MAAGGPLAGLSVVEIAALGPGPFCAMVLRDPGGPVRAVPFRRWAGGRRRHGRRDTEAILAEAGFDREEVAPLRVAQVIE